MPARPTDEVRTKISATSAKRPSCQSSFGLIIFWYFVGWLLSKTSDTNLIDIWGIQNIERWGTDKQNTKLIKF